MDAKTFLVNFIKERIYSNNSRLVTAAKVQEAVLRVVDNVYQKQDYSVEEQLTGANWVDGLPIYRRTINLNLVTVEGSIRSAVFQLSQSLGSYFCIESATVVFVDSSSALPLYQQPHYYAGLGCKFLNVYASFLDLTHASLPNMLDYVHVDIEESYQIINATLVIAYTKPQGAY